ncbi:hypothetical protein EOL96_08205, partial [Candidatus Saccharibacteria bacterium]|nr:hypothetical protein [Candidatus Saccharibacteria bacterium]
MKHLVALITTIALATLFVLLVPSPAFAAVGAGGVWGGGVGSGYNTRNGWGWYRYNVSGAGITPSYFFSGTNWATVRNICAAEGDNYVIGFTLRNPDGLHAIHDDLGWGEAVLSNFLGNSGLPWMNRASALALYNTLPAAQKVGYTFGSNVGWFCYSDSNWTTTGSTTVNRATAAPGNTVVWTHTLRNNGPTATGVNVRSSTVGSGFGNAFDGEKNIVNAPMLSGQVRNPVSWQTYTVAPGDVGKTLCQQLRWTPTNSSGGVNGMTSRCVSVPYSYTLTPQVSAIPFDAVEPGTSYTVNSSIANSGPTRSRSSQWQLSYFTLSPGVAIPVGGISGATIPCTFFSTA